MFLPLYIWHGGGSWHLGYITPSLDMPCMAMCTVDRWVSTFQGGVYLSSTDRSVGSRMPPFRFVRLLSLHPTVGFQWTVRIHLVRHPLSIDPLSFLILVSFHVYPGAVPVSTAQSTDRPRKTNNLAEAGSLLLLGVSFQTWVDRWPPLIPGTSVPVPTPSQGPDLDWAGVAERDLPSAGTPAFSGVRNAWRVPPPFEPEWIRFQTGKGSGSIGRR